jgi:hypothetical protein
MLQNHIRLDDLLARHAGAQWFEGIAIVQTVCRQLLGPGAGGAGFPAASDILIGPEGSVAVLGISGVNAVPTAAHLLARMLSDDVPVRLRLVVTQATGTECGYASLREFSEALAYFERPNPEAIVKAFRERVLLAPVREDAANNAPAHAPVGVNDVVPPKGSRPRHLTRWAVLVATVAAVACGSVWLIGMDGDDPRLAAALSSLKDSVVRTVSPGPAAAADVEKGTTGLAPAKPGKNLRAKRKAPVVAPAAGSMTVVAFDLEWRPLDSVEPPRVATVGAGAPPALPSLDSMSDASVYSLDSAGVVPPVGVRPQLPRQLPADVNPDDLGRIDLIISEDGTVLSVKLLGNRRSVHDAMMLSAAKAWEFTPALKDGHPVKYRKTVWLSMQ